ncbi:GDSL-type esterase/lipase family protein [Dickeya dadantii]|uniref:GDSL-type esterase/lipase family protein n=1 Tax=Dickeya dadantii TaxID=204038 RepID=UPI001CF38124|nr:GDSL-type esterase/lipase family protein [Dickeya dadantii]MCA7011789.1 GDSL-type esterase/lipase family protein [Dickeya dadantii]
MMLTSCYRENSHAPQIVAEPAIGRSEAQLVDYGDAGVQHIKRKLAQSNEEKVHILQIGDSHTAADFFSGQLRHRFQQQYGDGGVGFISPLAVPGNRYERVVFSKAKGWNLISSRRSSDVAFTLGGNIATPVQSGNTGQFTVRDDDESMKLQALYRNQANSVLQLSNQTVMLPDSQSRWQLSPAVTVRSPVSYSLSMAGKSQLAGWQLTSSRPGGVMLSALGINGAQVTMLDKWHDNWPSTLQALKPDMIILAYGTNEAFDRQLDIQRYQQNYQQYVQTIRQVLPNTVILLVGPGSSINNKVGASCQQRQPEKLNAVILAQREVARANHALFWNWFDYMGGDCAIEQWQTQGDARADLIHLTQQGYQRSADALWQQFSALLQVTTAK